MKTLLLKKFPSSLSSSFSRRKPRILPFFLAFFLVLLTHYVLQEIFTVKIPIFGFHDIVNLQHPQKNISKYKPLGSDYYSQNLAEFLDYLVQKNYWFLSTQELYDYFLAQPLKTIPKEHKNQKRVMLTFDDGYKSIDTELLPILEKLESKYSKKVKVVLFVNSGFMGKSEKVSCEDLRKGFKKGFYDIQSHGLNHLNLTQINEPGLHREMSQDQIRLRKCVQGLDPNQTVASHLAYPFGSTNEKVEKVAKKYFISGYIYNSLKVKLTSKLDKYRLSRLTIHQNHDVKRLISLSGKGWLSYLPHF